jgi:hypothetical protein
LIRECTGLYKTGKALATGSLTSAQFAHLKLDQPNVTLKNCYEMQFKRPLTKGTVSLMVMHLPAYLRGVTGKTTQAPPTRVCPRNFNLLA